jgi:polar amino acid transport system permease protein
MSSQIWSEQTNVADMMCMLLLTYVAIIAVINVVMRSLERRLRIPGFGQ